MVVTRGNLPPRTSSGFTLLELLLAFVVFALSFATVLEILSGSMRNTVKARQFTEAALVAQSVMDQVGIDIPLEVGRSGSGEFGSYFWELGIYSVNPTSLPLTIGPMEELTEIQLLEVELLVTWGAPPREQSRMFHTMRAVTLEPGR